MAVRYRIDRASGVIFNTYWGVVTDEDLYSHQREMLAHPDFSDDLHQLSNYLDVTDNRITSITIRSLAETRTFRPGVLRAIVVDGELGYGLSRMFQILHDASGEEVQVFRDLAAARRWLGLDAQDAENAEDADDAHDPNADRKP